MTSQLIAALIANDGAILHWQLPKTLVDGIVTHGLAYINAENDCLTLAKVADMRKVYAGLAEEALPKQDFPDGNERGGLDDWGSPRQVDAQNDYFLAVEQIVSPDAFARLEAFCLHADVYEMIREAQDLVCEALDEIERQQK